jgi:hypothetical protein
MIDGIGEDDYLAWNYDFFRIHRVIPPLGKDNRANFRLKDLQVTALTNNPSFGRSILASLMKRMYDALWIEVESPKDILVDPGQKTMRSLARQCHETASLKHDTSLGGAPA